MYAWEESLIRRCIELGDHAALFGDVAIGAVVCDENGRIVGEGFNTRERDGDPVGHAEINALREAGKRLGRWNLARCTLAVNLEPCTMCAGAIVNARITRVVFGAWDEKAGAAGSIRDVLRDSRLPHTVETLGGVLGDDCAAHLKCWFAFLRANK